jgi:hypothetical protein
MIVRNRRIHPWQPKSVGAMHLAVLAPLALLSFAPSAAPLGGPVVRRHAPPRACCAQSLPDETKIRARVVESLKEPYECTADWSDARLQAEGLSPLQEGFVLRYKELVEGQTAARGAEWADECRERLAAVLRKRGTALEAALMKEVKVLMTMATHLETDAQAAASVEAFRRARDAVQDEAARADGAAQAA